MTDRWVILVCPVCGHALDVEDGCEAAWCVDTCGYALAVRVEVVPADPDWREKTGRSDG